MTYIVFSERLNPTQLIIVIVISLEHWFWFVQVQVLVLAETVVDSLESETVTDIQRAKKQLNQEMHIQAIEIVSEAMCCIIFGQSCMLCIILRRKMCIPEKVIKLLHGPLLQVGKTLRDLQIVGCELHENASGSRWGSYSAPTPP